MESSHEDLKEANLRQLTCSNKKFGSHVADKITFLKSKVKVAEKEAGRLYVRLTIPCSGKRNK
jgi:hypothetical protein